MKKIVYIFFTGLVLSFQNVTAQFSEYAIQISQTDPTFGSTARMQAIGGAQASLGADLSTLSVNPAGLGFLNRSVMSFTPSLNFADTETSFEGSRTGNYSTNFNFANLGVAFNTNPGKYSSEKFKGGSFAITLQRNNTFNNEFIYQGRNTQNSITDFFIEDANQFGATFDADEVTFLSDYAYSQFLIEQADSYLIEPNPQGGTDIYPQGDFEGFTSLVGARSGFNPRQTERVTTSGNNYGLNFAWGGNYNDQIYFGAGLSFKTINYSRTRNYTEDQFTNNEGVVDDLVNSIQINEEERLTGTGVDFNAGLIVRPIDFITLGVSYISPTFYSLDREREFRIRTDMSSEYYYYDEGSGEDSLYFQLGYFDSNNDPELPAPPLFIDQFNLRTPSKLTVGASGFIGKFGFVTADVEYINYGSAFIKSDDLSADQVDNDDISGSYSSTFNYRVGGELRLDAFRVRGGYGFFGDFDDRDGYDSSRDQYSFGLGYRQRDFFIDLAFVHRNGNQTYAPYIIQDGYQPLVDVETKRNTVSATVGFNF